MLMKKLNKQILIIALITLSLLLPVKPLATATAAPINPVSLDGVLNGAPYSIRVPANWNGTLLVYAHGYREKADHPGETEDRRAFSTLSPLESPQYPDMEAFLLLQGYALAGSAYRDNGWAVKEGIEDTFALINFFRQQVGQPQRTILYGFSMGSLIALKGAERPIGVSGAICACGLGAGGGRTWDSTLDFALAYQAAFGWPAAWGSPGDVRNDLDFETEVLPVIFTQLQNPLNFGRFEFIRLLTGEPLPGYYDGTQPAPWLFLSAFFATEGRAEIERRAGGRVTQNRDHVYALTDQEKAYLASLGVDANPLLSGLNFGLRGFNAQEDARRYLVNNFDPTGRILVPVLTLKTMGDGLTPTSHDRVYRDIIASNSRLYLLSQTYTNGIGHCSFTPDQLLKAIQAMEQWITTGERPGSSAFPEALGFVPGFEPPRWPQPVKVPLRRLFGRFEEQ